MRIISGIYRGRRLKSPPKNARVRPTTDRVRETLFNILANRINFTDASALDLFCGTGAFGIEFLSRGSEDVTFVDKSIRLVEENLALIKSDSKVVRSDVLRFLKNRERNYDVIFADPPYDYTEYKDLIKMAIPGCSLFILEHSSGISFENSELKKDFGDTTLTFFAK